MPRLNRRVTMADVAEHAGDKVLKAVGDLGYRPSPIARSLATDETLCIGIVVPSLSNPYFGAILEGTENVLWENDYHILLCNTEGDPDREKAVMDLFEDHRVDGVLILSAHGPVESWNRYVRSQLAVVALNTQIETENAACIYTNEVKSMSIAVDHLAKEGRRHLGYVGLNITTYAGRERRRGFEMAVRKAGLESADGKYMIGLDNNDHVMYPAIRQLLQSHTAIDGLVCFNDGITARTIRTCAQLGIRVPDDIAIIGYDDAILAEVITPSLTTLDLTTSKQEVGELAGRLMLQRIENIKSRQDDVILNHRLIVRDSAP